MSKEANQQGKKRMSNQMIETLKTRLSMPRKVVGDEQESRRQAAMTGVEFVDGLIAENDKFREVISKQHNDLSAAAATVAGLREQLNEARDDTERARQERDYYRDERVRVQVEMNMMRRTIDEAFMRVEQDMAEAKRRAADRMMDEAFQRHEEEHRQAATEPLNLTHESPVTVIAQRLAPKRKGAEDAVLESA